MIAAVLLSSLLGFIALAMAMDKHCKHVLRRALAPRWLTTLRVVGWALLVLSLSLSIVHWGWGIGMTAWLGWLMLSGFALVFYLPNWPWQPEQPKAPPRREKKVAVVVDAEPVVVQTQWFNKSAIGALWLVPVCLVVWLFVAGH